MPASEPCPSETTAQKPETIYIDLETTGLNPAQDEITTIGFRVRGRTGVSISELAKLLEDPNNTIVGHNVKFDVAFLSRAGFTIKAKLFDTKVLAYCANPFRQLGLGALGEEVLKVKHITFDSMPTKKKELDPTKTYTKVGRYYISDEELAKKNQEDVELTARLSTAIPQTEWFRKVEQPLTDLLAKMETKGLNIDQPYLKGYQADLEARLAVLEKDIKAVVPIVNLNSGQQMSRGLKFIKLPLERYAEKTKTGHWGVDKTVLKKLAWDGHTICNKILEYRKLFKLKSTYVDMLLEDSKSDGRIHGFFNQAGKVVSSGDDLGTRTGRLSSSDPNLQNIPARSADGLAIRRSFIPSKDCLLFDTDLKQIEPRYVAYLTQSPKLIKAYNTGIDTHALFASDIFSKDMSKLTKMERFIGKSSWLATVYGCTPPKLKFICELFSEDRLPYDEDFYREVQDNFWAKNPEIAAWRRCHIESTRRLGYIKTYGGRTIHIPNLNSKREWERQSAERQAVNYAVQGSCADIMKLIMLEMDNKLDVYLLAVVHDEIVGEYNQMKCSAIDMKKNIDYIMTNTCSLKNVPIEADTKIVSNWGEAK